MMDELPTDIFDAPFDQATPSPNLFSGKFISPENVAQEPVLSNNMVEQTQNHESVESESSMSTNVVPFPEFVSSLPEAILQNIVHRTMEDGNHAYFVPMAQDGDDDGNIKCD